MSEKPPGILAVRALNQYRSREVMTYLGLRYYLDNTAARSDDWAQRVATDLVLTRTDLPYFQAHHFKEVDDTGAIFHRPIFVPAPNEALAEAALLAECATHPEVFFPPDGVFSYRLSENSNSFGMYQYYFSGFQERQNAIKTTCQISSKGEVRYVDIKRFYPSITTDLAHAVWEKYTKQAHLTDRFVKLGQKLIEDHGKVTQIDGSSEITGRILTGPMFSHLIGNLVLRSIDEQLSKTAFAHYFRYVDDITLVGDPQAVNCSLDLLKNQLDAYDLELHDENSPKNITLSPSEWLEGEPEFQYGDTLTRDIKNFLFTQRSSFAH